jgi:hypothetical protein
MTAPDWWKPYAAKWPRWQVWRGVDKLFYASRQGADPPLITRGESADDLSDMITRAESDGRCWWQHR